MDHKEAKRKLFAVTGFLQEWQADNTGETEGRCLEAVRHACTEAGLRLPVSNVDYKGMFAITCGETLGHHPDKWGWKLLGTDADAIPTDRPSLLFFEDCGKIADGPHKGQNAGHVAIFKPTTAHIVANTTYNYSANWAHKVAYVFEVA